MKNPYKKKTARGAQAGFSMIELLCAVVIFSIMSLALYVVFDRANEVWRHGEHKSDQYQNARTVLDTMSRELTSALIAAGGPSSFSQVYGRPYLWSQNQTGGSDYDQDEIFFVFARSNALYETGYYINDGTAGAGNATAEDDTLVRAFTASDAADFDISSTGTGAPGQGEFGSYDDFAFKVTDFSLNFIYRNINGTYEAANVWDTRMGFSGASTTPATTEDDGRLPDFIEISIRVVGKDILEKYGDSPPKTDRKEFKIMIPTSQRSLRNE